MGEVKISGRHVDKRPWITQDPHVEVDRGIFYGPDDKKFYVDYHCGYATCTVEVETVPDPETPSVTVLKKEVFQGPVGRDVALAALTRWKQLHGCTIKKETP